MEGLKFVLIFTCNFNSTRIFGKFVVFVSKETERPSEHELAELYVAHRCVLNKYWLAVCVYLEQSPFYV